uniref:Uncharacterized protein n=1 Tax=Manihot esculenta TaxID=3983 RepID=A0A2C9UGV1_MANES
MLIISSKFTCNESTKLKTHPNQPTDNLKSNRRKGKIELKSFQHNEILRA